MKSTPSAWFPLWVNASLTLESRSPIEDNLLLFKRFGMMTYMTLRSSEPIAYSYTMSVSNRTFLILESPIIVSWNGLSKIRNSSIIVHSGARIILLNGRLRTNTGSISICSAAQRLLTLVKLPYTTTIGDRSRVARLRSALRTSLVQLLARRVFHHCSPHLPKTSH